MQGLVHIIITFLVALTLSSNTTFADKREAIEIGIGIGIGGGSFTPGPSPSGGSTNCPPPPQTNPPSKPSPSPLPKPPSPSLQFENDYIRAAYYVIQKFKKTLDCSCDKMGVLDTWNGSNVCNNAINNKTNVGYKGFYCETPPDRVRLDPTKTKLRGVASVDFNTFNLCGKNNMAPLSNFIDKLPDLALFHANSNNFTSTIPNLSKLRYFYELDVSNNNHTGCFPTTVLPLKLSFLDLRFNQFIGIVPPQAFSIPTQVLFLNNNHFTGSIPSNLGSTPANYITFANNYFTGAIPRSIGQASNTLFEILFLNNQLSGCLPSEIGLLKKATVFDAGFNRITGPIPLSFRCLFKVEQLNLAGNLLYGEVPDVVCMLCKYGNLQNLSLSYNYFTKLGPSCYDLIQKNILHVKKNCIPGLPEQRSTAECNAFLNKPKLWCPNVNYVPCKLPKDMDGEGERSHVRSSGYTTYSALHVIDQKP